ncbi:hypothetical protein M942_22670 [Enterobacter ludwigii]|jgi:hypothetical protein|nr:hypothetical protein M942_08530 [Enterobacter ludwigii]AHE73423.1 hypothetical protein M942_22670 [Enterobacter ludwigii]
MNQNFNREKQQKILQKLRSNYPNFTTEEDYEEMLALFGDERELNRHLRDMKSRGLITVTLIETLTGHICEISSLAYVQG